nr:hypothetical protein [Tanacetum cinerariifolium]
MVSDEEQLAFLANPEVDSGLDTQTTLPINAAFQTDDLDAFDSDYDEAPAARVVFMANLSTYDSETLSEDFDQGLHKEINDMKAFLIKWKLSMEQSYIDEYNKNMKHEIHMSRLGQLDIVNIVVHDHVKSVCMNVDVCESCVTVETEHQNDFIHKECYDTLFHKFNALEKHCISLEADNQLKKENFQRNTLFSQESAPTFAELFEINELKAQSQAKETWKSRIKSYIDTKPDNALIHYCLKNPPYKFTWADKEVAISEGIDNDIYSTVDDFHNACEMWKATERGAGYDNQRLGNVTGARETVGTMVVQKSRIQCYNSKEFLHVAREEAGIQLNANQADWRDHTDDEFDDQELKAHYMYMAQIQEVSLDAADSGPIFDSEQMQKIDQNDDDDDLANERELLASLIEKLKCEIDDSKNRNKVLETSKRRNDVEYALKVEIDCEKAKGDLISYKMESQKSFNKYTQTINDLNQTISEMKKKLFAHQETISILSQAKEAQIKLYKTHEDKELDKVIALENKVKVLDNIVYKTGQSVQTMNMLNSKCRMSFAKPEFLKKAQRVNPRMYDIGCYNDNLTLMLAPKSDEVIRLKKEIRSKLSDLIRPFDYDKLNNLYDLFISQREKSSEQRYFSERSRMSHTPVNNGNSNESFNKQTTLLEKWMDESILWDQKCKSSKELFKIKRSVGMIFDGVEHCKETITKRTYFGHIDPFIQNTIEANFCPKIRKINVDLEKFRVCLKEEMVADLRYFNSLELESHEVVLIRFVFGFILYKAIFSGADNRPPMLEKDMYDSWKSGMELYMLNRQHGRMILESVENGPLLWPTVKEDGVTQLKKYSELSAAEAIQADYDVKATNIILQGLSPKVYALVSTPKVAKELWERIQMLMQGTSLTKQGRECRLYDEFDKFSYRKGESLSDFDLRFSLLLNDMNMYNMKLKQF